MPTAFYSNGLSFACRQCSHCCRHEPGYVYLRRSDVVRLAKGLNTKHADFIETYCRWIDDSDRKKRLSLKEKANYDCIFWKDGCLVYEHRPLQCRSFPFWEDNLSSKRSWNAAASECPGMNSGTVHSQETIENWLEQQQAESVIIMERDK